MLWLFIYFFDEFLLELVLEHPNKKPTQLLIKSLNCIIDGVASPGIRLKSYPIISENKAITQTDKATIT